MPVSDVTGLITYQEVVDQTGTKDDLFNRCSQWLHTFYANPWEATKIRDQATGLIKIQHQFRIYDTDEAGNQKEAGTILYTCKIEFKENRYRYTIDNFMLKQVSRYPVETWMDKSRGDYSEKWIDYLAQINQYITEELIRSLKEKMQPEEAVKEAEW
jgi:LPS O-antigen subunit length determinant protein (WzzB/FepE family)